MNQPQPDPTPRGPAYQGRLLPRPDEEVVDQGLDFDVRTLLSRRRMLKAFGLGAGMFALAACGVDAASTSDTSASGTSGGPRSPTRPPVPTPATAPTDRTCSRSRGIVRSDIRSCVRHLDHDGRGCAAGVRADHPGHGQRTTRRSPGSRSTPGTATATAGTRCTPRAWRTRTTCAASRSPTPRARSASPASSRRATPVAGRTSTSRSTRTRRRSPTPPTRSPRPSWRFPEDVVDLVYATEGYEASVANLAQVSPGVRQRLRRRRRRAPARHGHRRRDQGLRRRP